MKNTFLILSIFLICTFVHAQEEPAANTVINQEQELQMNAQANEQEEPDLKVLPDAPPQGEAAPTAEAPVKPATEGDNPQEVAWYQKYADQPYLALLNEYETTLHADWSYEETYHSRIKIQKEEGKQLGQWPIYYNKSRDNIVDIQAYVETADGHRYPAKDIQDMQVYDNSPMYSDMRMKMVTLPQVSVGAVIDVQVKSTTTHKEIPNQYWGEILYPAVPTLRSKHVFIFPEDKPIDFKSYKMDHKPTIEKSDGKETYTFSFEMTDPIPDQEDMMPPLQETLGGMYLSSMNDWKIVADWYRDLIFKNMVDDSNISTKVNNLILNKTTQKDKAKAILEFIQDEFRYVGLNFGDNTVEPHPTKDIYNNRYGDCKDLALLTKQMFKIAGIDSNIVLFSEEYAGNPQVGLPNISVFSHVILQANLDGQDYFVDPQLKGFDFGEFPSSYDNAYLLIIDDLGYKFANMPIAPAEGHFLDSHADITVASDGSAEFRVHVKLPLESSLAFRKTWGSSTNGEKDKFFDNLQQNFAKNGKMIDRKVIGAENRYGPIEFELRFQSPNAYPLVNDMLLIREEDQSNLPEFAEIKRQYPIFVANNSMINNMNVYHLPDGFKIDTVPSNYSLSTDLMDMSVNYAQKEGVVEINSKYNMKRCNIPIDHYAQIKDFRTKLFKKADQYVIFKKNSDVSTETKDWIKK